MLRRWSHPHTLRWLVIGAVLASPARAVAADLKPRTAEAFARYIQATEARIEKQRCAGQFLYIDTLSEKQRRQVLEALRRGEVWSDSVETLDAQGHEVTVPDGLVTHWVGAAFFPHTTLDRVLTVVQDYNHYQDFYKPEIVRSRLLRREGDTFQVSSRVQKKTSWASPTFNIETETQYTRLDVSHACSRSTSTRIAQVSNVGSPREVEMTPGHDNGYLWRFNSYWRFEAYQDGVLAEWEAVTLSRDVPFFLRWAIRPFVDRLARGTLQDMLVATRRAVNGGKTPLAAQNE